MQQHILTSLVTLSLLTACGGSGDDNAPADKPQTSDNTTTGKTYFLPEYTEAPNADGSQSYYSSFVLNRDGNTFMDIHIGKGMTVNTAPIPAGFSEFPAQMRITEKNGRTHDENVAIRSYQGFHSGILTINGTSGGLVNRLEFNENGFPYMHPTQNLPSTGKATYNGRAFDSDPINDATLRYTIDFGARRGSGEITASRGLGRITLHDAPITSFPTGNNGAVSYGIEGRHSIEGTNLANTYSLGIAGPNAEEIVGKVNIDNDRELSFYGTRGAISP